MQPRVPRHAHEPVVRTADGAVIAHEVLAFQAHLEPLTPNDGPALEAAVDVVGKWVGGRLRWSRGSMTDGVQPFAADDLTFVAGIADLLTVDLDGVTDEEERIAILSIEGERVAKQGITCGGSSLAEERDAQLVSTRFYADVVRLMPDATFIPPYSVLRVTVPTSEPLPEFVQWCSQLAAALPVRWASAGLYLNGAETGARWELWKQAAKAYGGRHWGVDVGEYVGLLDHFYDWIRSVNWLTWLGPTMVRDLEKMGRTIAPNDLVAVAKHAFSTGDGLVLQAGDRPQRGDINRLQVPPAYRAVDELVRPRRSDGEDVTFFGEWTHRETADWLRRFERRTDAA